MASRPRLGRKDQPPSPSLIVATPTSRHRRATGDAFELARVLSARLPCRTWVTRADGLEVAAFEVGDRARRRDEPREGNRAPTRPRPRDDDLPPEAHYG